MFRLVAAILIAATCPTSASSATTISQYQDAISYCAGEDVWNYDDGVSPANVVAKILLGICRRQNQALYSYISAEHSNAFMAGFNRASEEEFTSFVLFHRANK